MEAQHAVQLYSWLLKGGVAIWQSKDADALGWLALPLNPDGTVPAAPEGAEGEVEVLTDASQVRVFQAVVDEDYARYDLLAEESYWCPARQQMMLRSPRRGFCLERCLTHRATK